ncbi:basic-leucine zipper (bZIP) transcription factor family protein [Tasmannia lanceolata]|uniref:basic-leucine zipper (bZIP) transcription factor family protein n=1 Tax=Tasmannia lanceolata TaxID=3420 RepID=UPI004063C9D7
MIPDFIMDDGELDSLNQEVFSCLDMDDQLPTNCSWDSFFDFHDDVIKDTQCTHTHTCNPPGPDSSHTHICHHVHTQHTKILSPSDDEKHATDGTSDSLEKTSKKRPLGNREAVRKYREKKKARTASLEDEVVRLRAINQQLMKRLQGQSALEAEIARLKCLLVDIRGRIEGEIGSFPYQKFGKRGDGILNSGNQNLSASFVLNPCDLSCDDQVYCLRSGVDDKGGEGSGLNGQGFGACEIEGVPCMESLDSGSKKAVACGNGNVVPTRMSKKKRALAATEG